MARSEGIAARSLLSFDLASTIERLGEAWPRELVRPSDVAATAAFARTLAPAFHWLMLETRLTPRHGERVDMLASIVDQSGATALARGASVRGAPLVERWARRGDPLLAEAHVLWLEWDAPFDAPPLQIASLDRRFWGAPGAPHSVARQVALYDAIHLASFGQSHDTRVLDRLGLVLGALAPHGTALFGASLAPRGRACDRLFVALPPARAMEWLRAVRWPGDQARAERWLASAIAPWEMAFLQIEITAEGLTPYLAIESRQTTGSRSERRARTAFLTRLVTSGQVPRARADAALGWMGVSSSRTFEEVRSLHLKCALGEAEEVEVKAYLGVHHLLPRSAS